MTENQLVQSSFFQTDLFANISYHTDSANPKQVLNKDIPQQEMASVEVSTSAQGNLGASVEATPLQEAPILQRANETLKKREPPVDQLSDGERQTSFEFALEAMEIVASGAGAEASIMAESTLDLILEPEVEAPSNSDHQGSHELQGTETLPLLAPLIAPLERKPVFIQEISLPAALCDEALILEINSIPNKMGFKIGEVAEMLGIKQYVLRYWESEFDVLKPKKAANNQRYFTKKDVENAYLIRKLLHRDRFSIEGAKSAMKELKSFVKTEVKKERVISNMSQTLQSADDSAVELLANIRKIKSLFQDTKAR